MPGTFSNNTNSILKKLSAASILPSANALASCFKDNNLNSYCIEFTKISNDMLEILNTIPNNCQNLMVAMHQDKLNLRHSFWQMELFSNLSGDFNDIEKCIIDQIRRTENKDFTNYIPIVLVMFVILLTIVYVIGRFTCLKQQRVVFHSPLREVVVDPVSSIDRRLEQQANLENEKNSLEKQLDAIGFNTYDIPDKYICSLSGSIMEDPVRHTENNTKFTFERSYILKSKFKDDPKYLVHPFTRSTFRPNELEAATDLKIEIKSYVRNLVAQHNDNQRAPLVSDLATAPKYGTL